MSGQSPSTQEPLSAWQRTVAEAEVAAVIEDLPSPLRNKISGIPVVFEAIPTRAMVRDGVEPDLMGLFEGVSYGDSDTSLLPPRIILFLQNIWEEAEHSRRRYRREVRKTLLHEIGHYLGLDEEGLIDRDLE